MDRKDYYKILGVSETATPDAIKKTYRNLAFRYHPDKNPGSQEMMKEINEAYAVLSNPEKKRDYDRLRQSFGTFARDRFRQTHTDEDIFRNSDINQIFEELSRIFGFSRPEDIFSRDTFYGRNYREFRFNQPGKSTEILITVPPGIKEGQKIKHRGLGEEGKNGSEARPDPIWFVFHR
jgi:DnaJ-class molecular chaperone